MKCFRRIMAACLAMLMLMTMIPTSAFAAEPSTPKEEVVYININQDGSVKEIYVVNIFELDADGRIIDYGDYETLRNMTTMDEITYADSKVSIDTKAGKLYYEGKLNSNVMPWDIAIHYYMDGVEYTAKEIAGRSGALKITMSIRKNTECNSAFFEGYALQTTFVLDTEKCKNIVAENATIANVGSDKQLTYTILPNKETDIEITANVRDFEMDGIAINGIRLNLNIEMDNSKLQDKIKEIMEAAEEMDEGAVALANGAGDLHDATGILNEKVAELHDGVGLITDGAVGLSNGLSALTGKNAELTEGALLAYSALCTAAQMQLNAELVANGLEPVTLTPDNYSKVLLSLIEKMDAKVVKEQAYQTALLEVTAQVEVQADELYMGYIKSQENELYVQGATQMVYEQLVGSGYPKTQAEQFLQTPDGQAMITNGVATMTSVQKQQVLEMAYASLTEIQKEQIRSAYVSQLMESEQVTRQIEETVEKVSGAASTITDLKEQLDSYGAFYQGLLDYTSATFEIAEGAFALQGGLETLYTNTNVLSTSVAELNTATGKLSDGAEELSDGTGTFAKETSGMDKEVSDEIDALITTIAGADTEVISFVSEENTDVKAVQFVIKTDAIQVEEVEVADVVAEETLNFWQKLLRLFGLY